MTDVTIKRRDNQACIHVMHGKITAAGGSFSSLTGYDGRDIIGMEIQDALGELLRYSPALSVLPDPGACVSGYIFTPAEEAREVTLSVETCAGGSVLYLLEEKPDSRIDDRLSVLEPLFRDEFMSVALYSVPDYIVLKSNMSFRDFFRRACRACDNVLGSTAACGTPGGSILKDMLDAAMENGKVTHFSEMKFVGADGQETYRFYTFLPIFVNDSIKYIVETSKDFTEQIAMRLRQERYTAEIKLQKEKLEAVIESLSDPLVIFDKEGKYETLNEAARIVFGGGGDGALNKVGDIGNSGVFSDFDDNIIPPGDGPGWRVFRGETIRSYQLKTKSTAQPYYFEVSGTPILDESGAFAYGIMYSRNITEHFRYQKEITGKNKLLSAVIENLYEALLIFDGAGRLTFMNAKARTMYPFFNENTTIESMDSGVVLSDADGNKLAYDKLPSRRVMRGETIRNENVLVRFLNMTRFLEINAMPIFDEIGQLVSAVITHHDITERKEMENALRESEKTYRMASEGSGAGVYAYDFLENKGYWSTQYKTILGLATDAPVTFDTDYDFKCVHPEDRDRVVTALSATFNPEIGGNLDITYRIIRPDGAVRWVHARGQTFFAGEGEALHPYLAAGSISDITDEKTTGDKIRRLSEELTHIIESTDDYILTVDKSHKVAFYNTAARRHFLEDFGYDLSKIDTIADVISPRQISMFKEIAQQAWEKGSAHFEFRTPKSGKIVSYSVNPVFIDDALVEVTVFGKDITERLNTEREIIRLNASLEERVAERTTQLEQSISDLKNISLILSHDLKTVMRCIGMYAGEILEGENVRDNALKIKSVNSELVTMVDGLMLYEKSARSAIIKKGVNIKKMIVSVFNELNSVSPERGILEFVTGLPTIMADKNSLRHVVLNILSNALKFTVPERQPRIDVGCRAEDDFYVIYFSDNGIGFNKAYSERIFGVFERLHTGDGYEGSGVGLAIVRNIIQKHGGRVWADSEPGSGTTIFIALPMREKEDDACIR